jgi:hypothetical protein
MRTIVLVFLLVSAAITNAQQIVKGIVVDSISKQPLPFATVQAGNQSKGVISNIDGKFSIALNQAGPIQFSYSGYRSKTVLSSTHKENDSVMLVPVSNTLQEVVIKSQTDKIARIINTAIESKSLHNPDKYTSYECNSYYKMIVDIKKYGNYNMDSIRHHHDSLRSVRIAKRKQKDSTGADTSRRISFVLPSHVFMTETYTKRLYKRPAQTQEILLASKVSGLSKTYFANIITDVLPFHVYTDYIFLNATDFINPIAKGWKGRYQFSLEDELIINQDTVFIFRYAPKRGTSFNSLSGLVYINSNGYAISHFTGNSNATDSAGKRFIKFEHIYQLVDGKWFPQEMNYDFGIPKVPEPYMQLVWNGHSLIDSVLFGVTPSYKFDKAHPTKFSDSVDLYSAADWNRFRKDTLLLKEKNTYNNMDSLMRKTSMESVIILGGNLAATGRLPIGKLDLDVSRLFAFNEYEATRLGIGLYTNNKVSKYYSIGGWFGYGFKDKTSKYGASLTIYPKRQKENWIGFSYQNSYRLTGNVELHPDLARSIFQNWLLQKIDEFKEYAVSAKIKPGYWEIRPSLSWQQTGPLHYSFQSDGKTITSFKTYEASVGIRYAYGEKRVPFFDYYFSAGTKYPIVYASLGRGKILSAGYGSAYYRATATITFNKHINRWGNDRFQAEAGIVHSTNDAALPASFLLAGNGYRRDNLNFYLWGGFATMLPFDFYSDRYVSFSYRHSFDKDLWSLKWSKPYISIAHNFIYGSLQQKNEVANPGLQSYKNGYHETGLLLNRLLKFNFGFADINLDAGAFYHWQKEGAWHRNAVLVIGFSSGF